MGTDKPRFSITVSDELFQDIEDFRFENRYQSRSEATVKLIELGMIALKRYSREANMSEKEYMRITAAEFEERYKDSPTIEIPVEIISNDLPSTSE